MGMTRPPQQAFVGERGKYYVRYTTGDKSACMSLKSAVDYADIFGGTVHRHPYYPYWYEVLWQRFKNWVVKKGHNHVD